jgi:hypothetical protein
MAYERRALAKVGVLLNCFEIQRQTIGSMPEAAEKRVDAAPERERGYGLAGYRRGIGSQV